MFWDVLLIPSSGLIQRKSPLCFSNLRMRLKGNPETSYLSYNITPCHNPKDLQLHGFCTFFFFFFVTKLTDLLYFSFAAVAFFTALVM